MLTKLISWFKDNYDKVLGVMMSIALLGSLLYLALQAGTVREKQEKFSEQLSSWRPDFPVASNADLSVYGRFNDLIATPFQIVAPTSEAMLVFAPERRVTCPECHNPIPYAAMICTFCEFAQPVDVTNRFGYDSDHDGMPDAWENQYGFDPNDSKDAGFDKDEDGFTNLEEYEAGTDPIDPKSHPAYAEKLVVDAVVRDPFKLIFMSVSLQPDNSRKFGLNLRTGTRTLFAKLGDEVEGFVVTNYQEKIELRDPARPHGMTVDRSVLTLKRGADKIELVKGVPFPRTEYKVSLKLLIDNKSISGKINTEFELRDERYVIKEVKSFDSGAETVVIARLQDGKEFTIGRNIKQDKHASGSEGNDSVEAHGEGEK